MAFCSDSDFDIVFLCREIKRKQNLKLKCKTKSFLKPWYLSLVKIEQQFLTLNKQKNRMNKQRPGELSIENSIKVLALNSLEKKILIFENKEVLLSY